MSKIFDSIDVLLEEEEDTFVCVFIDEIETLAAPRERSLNTNEPFDAIRAVNALLTGLDRLRLHPNVVVICTSNLVTALVGLIVIHAQRLNELRTQHFSTGLISNSLCPICLDGRYMSSTKKA